MAVGGIVRCFVSFLYNYLSRAVPRAYTQVEVDHNVATALVFLLCFVVVGFFFLDIFNPKTLYPRQR